jgi:hypothetical protein
VHLGDHVRAVDDDRRASRRSQGHVQHGPVLGDVDLLAREHRIDARSQPRFLRELEQQLEALVGDPILRVVEVDADGLGRHPLAALRIARKELAQVQRPHAPVVSFERLPGRARVRGDRHSRSSVRAEPDAVRMHRWMRKL